MSKKTEIVKGYKVFKPDFTCGNFKYEVGKTYIHKGHLKLCNAGFHFCKNLNDCFDFYDFDPNNKVAEIEAVGEVVLGDNKSVTNKIKIVREISWNDVLDIVNIGKGNTGRENSGNSNSGYRNSGDRNSGARNSGHSNSGNWNSGMFNACNYSNGFFNSQSPKIYMFNKPTNLTYEEFQRKYFEEYNLLQYSKFYLTEWISEPNMTDEEKKQNPKYKATEGYLKVRAYKEACKMMWNNFSKTERNKIKKLPNFDKDVFEEITGIEIDEKK